MFDINLTSKRITTKDLVYIYSMFEKTKTNLRLEHWIFMKISFILIRQPSFQREMFPLADGIEIEDIKKKNTDMFYKVHIHNWLGHHL